MRREFERQPSDDGQVQRRRARTHARPLARASHSQINSDAKEAQRRTDRPPRRRPR
jgi:hypothetical protein